MKMAKRSSEEFQEVSVVSCEYLSDSFSFALLSSDAVSLCFRLRSLARSRFDCFCSISALGRSFSHVDRLLLPPVPCGPCSVSALARAHDLSIASWSDQYHVASSLGTRPQKPRPRNQSVTDIYIKSQKSLPNANKHM